MNLSRLKHKLILILSLIFIAFTSLLTIRYIIRESKEEITLFIPGYQYANFLPYTKKMRHLGFVTNKPMSPESGYEEFLQAQYMLAPTILKLNDYDQEYTLLDLMVEQKDQIYVFYMLYRLDAEKVVDNDWGRVLLRRKK